MTPDSRIPRPLLPLALLAALAFAAPASPQQTEWRELTPPSAIAQQALLFDEPRQRLLLFGGNRATRASGLTELWSLDASYAWHRLPGDAPDSYEGPTVVGDTRRERLLVFGSTGDFIGDAYSQTASYELSGSGGWTALPNGALDVHGALAVYASTRDRTVAWGGATLFQFEPFTREFRIGGTGWQVVSAAGTPPSGFFDA